jgi:hypothetical protein
LCRASHCCTSGCLWMALVQDQVHGKPFGHFPVDGAQELYELLVPVPRQALLDHDPGKHV